MPEPEEPADEPQSDDGTVLSPDELDITDEENVVELEDGRYVISSGGAPPNVTEDPIRHDQPPQIDDVEVSTPPELSEEAVHDWLENRLDSANSRFGFDITARFEDRVSQRALFSNDVVTIFENLVVWYAHQAGSDTPVEDVLGILLMESNLSIRFPPESLTEFASSHGLEGGDSLEALFSAAREAGGVRFPPDDD